METYPRPHRKDARITEAKKYLDIAENEQAEIDEEDEQVANDIIEEAEIE